jgi:hypothetical protein
MFVYFFYRHQSNPVVVSQKNHRSTGFLKSSITGPKYSGYFWIFLEALLFFNFENPHLSIKKFLEVPTNVNEDDT